MNDLSKLLFDQAADMNKLVTTGIKTGEALSARRIVELVAALEPFVAAYKKAYDPGLSDLYDEQPLALHVTLGDYRRAARALR